MFFKGVSFGFMARNGYYSSPAGKAEVQRIIESGADSVALMATIMQESYSSTRMFRDFAITPSDDEFRDTICAFHDAGLKVMVKPILENHDSTHRCEINFPADQEQIAGIKTDYWGPWFRNYTAAMVHYARLCQQEKVEMLCLGCEMSGVDLQEKYWPPLIEEVRKIYGGMLSYNTPSWWDYDMKQNWMRKWFSLLDMVGISFYYGVKLEKLSAETYAEALKPVIANLAEAVSQIGKPIFMAECGARSVENAIAHPSDAWKNRGAYDGNVQKQFLEGVVKAFTPCRWWKGLFWWKWDEQQDRPYFHQTGGDTGFTMYGKPAAEFFHDWIPENR